VDYQRKNFEPYFSWNLIDWLRVIHFIKNLQFLIAQSKKKNSPNMRQWQVILIRSRANILLSIFKITSANDAIFFFLNKVSIKFNSSLRWQLFLYFLRLNLKDLAVLIKYGRPFRFSGFSTVKLLIVQNMIKNALFPEWKSVFYNSSFHYFGTSFIQSISTFYFLLALQRLKSWFLTIHLKLNSVNLMSFLKLGNFWSFSIYRISIFLLQLRLFSFFKLQSWQFFDIEIKSFIETFTIFPLMINIFVFILNRNFENSYSVFWDLNLIPFLFLSISYISNLLYNSSSYFLTYRISIFLQYLLKRHFNIFSSNFLSIDFIIESFVFLGYQIQHKFSLLFVSPCSEIIFHLKQRLKNVWFRGLTSSPQVLILKLNPLVRNWFYYFRPFLSENSLSLLDFFVRARCWRYSKRRHSSKSSSWVYRKYFIKNDISIKPRFSGIFNNQNIFLISFRDFSLCRELLINDLLYSYKIFLSSTFWRFIFFDSIKDYFLRRNCINKCFFFCIFCRRLFLYDDFINFYIFDLYKKKYFFIIFHSSCLLKFRLLNVFLRYIQFRFFRRI
jgi:RNA-directed DNA polymerase